MPLSAEVVRSLFAAWRIARFDANAMSYFNLSLEGFWRSFTAALIVLPFLLVITGLQFDALNDQEDAVQLSPTLEHGTSLLGFSLLEVLSFVCRWAAWPILMIPIARFFKLEANYVPYIIAVNWGNVLQSALMLVVQVLLFTQILPKPVINLLFVMAFITVLYYAYLIARAGLQCDAMTAIGLVVLNLLVEVGISIGFDEIA